MEDSKITMCIGAKSIFKQPIEIYHFIKIIY